jgi:hypothetical protein
MTSYAEQLPPEIWLLVFQYFEAHDLFYAFDRLNSYFNAILASSYLTFYLRLREADNKYVQHSSQPHWLDSVVTRTICLRSVVQDRSSSLAGFLTFHAERLIRLETLAISLYPRDRIHIPSICKVLQELPSLKCLSLRCALPRELLEAILTIPTLHTCRLVLREQAPRATYQLESNSNIHELYLVFINNVDDLVIHLLLSRAPKLRRLEISGSYFSVDRVSLFSTSSFILPDLRILKLKLENGHLAVDCFQDLHSIMPRLKYVYLNYRRHILFDTFISVFIASLWPILEQISSVGVDVKGHLMIDATDGSIQMNMEKNRQILLDRAKQFPGAMKVKWTEQDFIPLRRIEILIEKASRSE